MPKRPLPKKTKIELITEVKDALDGIYRNDKAAVILYLLDQFTAWDLDVIRTDLVTVLKHRQLQDQRGRPARPSGGPAS